MHASRVSVRAVQLEELIHSSCHKRCVATTMRSDNRIHHCSTSDILIVPYPTLQLTYSLSHSIWQSLFNGSSRLKAPSLLWHAHPAWVNKSKEWILLHFVLHASGNELKVLKLKYFNYFKSLIIWLIKKNGRLNYKLMTELCIIMEAGFQHRIKKN